MAAKVQQINVQSATELENTILSYIAQGFAVSNRSEDSVTLFKKKEFNILWAIIGFFACVIPLIIYAIVYSQQSDEMIVIRVGAVTSPTTTPEGGGLTWSDDREWWWDGAKWRDASAEMPPGAQLSDDGRSWWDGTTWRPMPSGEPAELLAPPPAPPPPPEVTEPSTGE